MIARFFRFVVIAGIYGFSALLSVRGGDEPDAVLPLPQWLGTPRLDNESGAEGVPGRYLGRLLLPDASLTGNDHEPHPWMADEPLSINGEFTPSAPPGDLSLFLPDALLGRSFRPSQAPVSSPASQLRALSDDFLTVCRESPSGDHLIDPDAHVPETQKEDLLRFLQFHARDARIKAYVLVVDRDQEIPRASDISDVASGSLGRGDSCLAVYPLNDPKRARLFLSASIHKLAAQDYLRSVVEDCADDAAQVTDSLEQLHRFTVRLSIRLFWLEKIMGAGQMGAGQLMARASPDEVPQEILVRRQDALTKALLADADPAFRPGGLQWWAVVLGVVAGLAAGGVAYALIVWRRRRFSGLVWILPEVEVQPRLGGDFCGGGGAWIQYR